MRRISREDNPPNTERRCTALLQFIRRDIGDLVLSWLWVPGENVFIALWLAGDIFLAAEVGYFLVCYPVQPVVCDPGRHVEIVRVDYKV